MDWPGCSLDTSSIEHVCNVLSTCLSPPQCVQHLEIALMMEWHRKLINNLTISMPQSCVTLLAVRGNHTPYWKSSSTQSFNFLYIGMANMYNFICSCTCHYFFYSLCVHTFVHSCCSLSVHDISQADFFLLCKLMLQLHYPLIVLSSVYCSALYPLLNMFPFNIALNT